MSWKVAGAVRELRVAPDGTKLNATDKAVMLVLAEYCHPSTGLAWPSLDVLAGDACLTRPALCRVLLRLEASGVIAKRRRQTARGTDDTNEYWFPWLDARVTESDPRVTVDYPETAETRVTDGDPRVTFSTSEGNPGLPKPKLKNRKLKLDLPSVDLAAYAPAVQTLNELLDGRPGYKPSRAFLDKVAEKYAGLDLAEEAIKMLGWLDSKPRRQCSTAFVLNWLKNASTPRASPRASPTPQPARTTASRGIDRPSDQEWVERLTERSRNHTLRGANP